MESCLFDDAGPIGVAPSIAQRSLLVLLERMAPYLAQHLSAAANAPFAASAESYPAAAAGPAYFAVPEMGTGDDDGEDDEARPAGLDFTLLLGAL